VQINRLAISVRYSKFLVGGTANIGDIPESVVVIPVSRPSDTIKYLSSSAFALNGDSKNLRQGLILVELHISGEFTVCRSSF
jgi:hypothetical protein